MHSFFKGNEVLFSSDIFLAAAKDQSITLERG